MLPIAFGKKTLLAAPMAGVTDRPFRQMMRKFGNHPLFSEMVEADGFSYKEKNYFKKNPILPEEEPMVYQLLGKDALCLAKTALAFEQRGAKILDINMGCPVHKIIQKGKGSALMETPSLAMEIVEKVKAAVSLPVGVKIRLGIKEKTGLDFALKMEAAGADFITVHGRLQSQLYSGKADFEEIKKIKEALKIPVIGNGDINTVQQVEEKKQLVDALMVGRFLLGRPWGLALLEGKELFFDKQEIILEHFDKMLSYYGKKGLFVMRKHLAWYASGHKNNVSFRQQVFRAETPLEVQQLIKDFF
ncbi:MAG: tRNA-dihydrouridine synthase [Alphaproteobacteria bacterium]|nr:tRNA-dihydrouridine synthase [Alphaproteobacteria bacterium]